MHWDGSVAVEGGYVHTEVQPEHELFCREKHTGIGMERFGHGCFAVCLPSFLYHVSRCSECLYLSEDVFLRGLFISLVLLHRAWAWLP